MKKSKLIKSLIAFAISVAAVIGCISLVACGGGDDNNAVNSVSLNKPTLSLQVDDTETLVATTDRKSSYRISGYNHRAGGRKESNLQRYRNG